MRNRYKIHALGAAVALAGLLPIGAQALEGNENRLLELASEGQTDRVEEMLTRETEVNAPMPDGSTLLHWAVYYDDEELVRTLIEQGADVTVANKLGATPLAQAAIIGNSEVLGMLLEAGADPDEKGADAQTPLMIVARTDNLEAARVLLDAGADVNAVEQWRGQTALMWAAAQRQPDMVELLLDHGAEPDAQSWPNHWERQVTAEPRMKILPPGGFTPLLYAAREGCAECARHLIDAGADLEKADPEGVRPLLMATLNAQFDTARVLLENGANPNTWDIWGRNPLYATVDYNTLPHGGRADQRPDDLTSGMEMIQLLLDNGANPNLQLKRFPPYRALGPDRGADWPLRTGATPLFRAARGGDIKAMDLLLEHGALVQLPNEDGATPLMIAAGYGASPIDTRGRFRDEEDALAATRLLLETGEVDVNGRTDDGQTALFGAASQGYSEVVELLVEHGADPTIEDSRGNTVVDAAMGRAGQFGRGGGDEHVETAALLEKLINEHKQG